MTFFTLAVHGCRHVDIVSTDLYPHTGKDSHECLTNVVETISYEKCLKTFKIDRIKGAF